MDVRDSFDRPLRDLRVSVTDRCNFRCVYCMPKEVFGPSFQFLDREELLTYEEIVRLARLFIAHGVEKIRVTGGEPLVRRDLPLLIEQLAALDGLQDLTLTTNGALLPAQAVPLREAGLKRITVSLDSLDDATFRAMNDVEVGVDVVLAGIDAARDAGLWPIKVNAVVKRGLNDHSIVDLARHFHGTGIIVRFIEYMDVGTTNGWVLDHVVPAAEIVERIDAVLPLEPLDPNYRGEVAQRYRYRDGGGEVGVITSITQPFCGDCTRARLSPEGELFTCLFGATGFDLRALLRAGAGDDALAEAIARVWRIRNDRYSDLRTEATTDLKRVEMSHIGG
ncbi:MAG: GTP 3',8-cyclase MoaA [Dehalococcoidia bacterium]|nr:GTP 3',8-cyclase MoaA [Chloroflexota bacterium]MXZ88605.1 GTP 3',8-cyclase MoaA [Dehalococcoidia bacterium]MYI86582.1 GTP 3',8-cyclase MoaA [Dehalococcoidia bacterium]